MTNDAIDPEPEPTSRPSSPDGPNSPHGPGRIVAIVLAGAALLLAGAYAVGLALAGDTVPRHASVEGVAIGGLAPAAAADRLEQALAERATAPIPVTIADVSALVVPAEAGLAIDYRSSVEAAGGGRSFDPRHVVRVLIGGSETDAVIAVEAAKLETAVSTLATRHDREPADATISLQHSKIITSDARTGITLDRSRAAGEIRARYPTSTAIALPAQTAEPAVTTAEMQSVVRDVARPAVAAPIVVRAGQAGAFDLTPAMIGAALNFAPADGTLAPVVDPKKLREAAGDAIGDLELADHRDATVRLVNGKPKVIPSTDGTDIAAGDLAAAVRPALTKPRGERKITVKLSGAPARFTTADAEGLGIREVTGQFTTHYPYATYRNVNIGRAAQKINNTVLRPGQTFSLNKIVGERTKANGFVEGYIIQGGKFKKELGGGVSQSATTTFNAMFFAGLEDVEHQPHTLYIDRYPPGREATVAWPSLDLKFRNNTRYGVLVQAYVTQSTPGRKGSITVKMWSTKSWDKITSTSLARSNFTTGRDLTDDSARCEPQAPVRGFDVTYSRLFHRDGEVVKRERFRWRYAPTDRIRCV